MEYYLYIFGLGPAFFRTILPEKYYKNFCKLVQGVRIVMQRRITGAQVKEAHSYLVQFVEEFEHLYYQRQIDRLHFARPLLHTILHVASEIPRIGNGIITSQYTMERMIGELGRSIRQPSNPFANLAQIAIRRSQLNALKIISPELNINNEPHLSRYSQEVGQDYVFLRPRDRRPPIISGPQFEALQNSPLCTSSILRYQQ